MNIQQSYKTWSVTVKELKAEIEVMSRLPEFQRPLNRSKEAHEQALSKLAYWRIIRQKVVFMFILTFLLFCAVGLAGWSNVLTVSKPGLIKIISGVTIIYSLLYFLAFFFYKLQLKKYHSNTKT